MNEKTVKLKKPSRVAQKPKTKVKEVWTYTPEKGYHKVKEQQK